MLSVLFASRALLTAQSIQPADLWKQPVADADRKLAYGKDELQFGELRLPKTKGPRPVVVLVHGGCFVDRLPRRDPRDTTFETLRPLAAALTDAGVATWNLEYRRAGNPGGGYPGSFQDLAAGTDFLQTMARANQLDLDRVVLVGHSAGGPLVHYRHTESVRYLYEGPNRWISTTPLQICQIAVANLFCMIGFTIRAVQERPPADGS